MPKPRVIWVDANGAHKCQSMVYIPSSEGAIGTLISDSVPVKPDFWIIEIGETIRAFGPCKAKDRTKNSFSFIAPQIKIIS